MSAATVLYLIGMLGRLNDLLLLIVIISLGFTLGFLLDVITEYNNLDKEKKSKNLKKIIFCAFCAGLLLIFVPSEKTMYMMVGANYLQNSTIPNKVETIINEKLDYYLKETKEQLLKKEKHDDN